MDFNKNKIKNIIFDLGGVIINIDYSLLIKAFSAIGLPHFEQHFSQKDQRGVFDQYEKGLISSQDFRNVIKKQCNEGTTDDEIDAAWNSMILDMPKQRLDLLFQIKGKYRTFLLSNTNEIHMIFIHKYLLDVFQIPNFNGYFEKVYLSYEIKMRKPDVEIFEFVVNENHLIKDETLFIDDSVQHVESASKIGIQAFLLDVKKQTVCDLF